MERVAFLLESTGERLRCLLNPQQLTIRRVAGVRPRAGVFAGAPDDLLLFTGGGTTELKLELLFDVTLPGSTIRSEDVRDLTQPLWRLAENGEVAEGFARPPRVRFVWGKAWNVPGVVASVAERLEHFTAGGTPRRSWLRIRLLRTVEPPGAAPPARAELPLPSAGVELVGSGGAPSEQGAPGDRLDQLAQRYYGDPSLWRLIAAANEIDDPLHVPGGTVLRIPPRSGP